MKCALKRFLSLALALVMTLSMLPNLGHVHVHAEEVETVSTEPIPDYESEEVTEPVPDDETTEPSQEEAAIAPVAEEIQPLADADGTLSVDGLKVTYKKDAGNASSCIASGTTITATAQSKSGFSGTTAGQTTVTLTYTGASTASVSFSYTGTGVASLTIDGVTKETGSGSFTKTVTNGTTITIVFTSAKGSFLGKSTATLTMTDVAVATEKNVNVTFNKVDNGSYTVDSNAVSSNTTVSKKSTESFAVKATPATDYIFYAWYNETTGKYIDYNVETVLTLTDDATVYPVFVHKTTALFGVGSNTFISLTEAGKFAASSTIKTIILLNNGTVSGTHTIPFGVTLLVPFDSENTLYTSEPKCTSGFANNVAWVKPTAYRTLTLAADAHITVNGAISISGQHAASIGGKPYCGAPTGPVGWVQMTSGSQITLNSGANLYCWGFIQGSGSITAEGNSTVYENFQFTDFRGGSNLTQMVGDGLVFPINQYYVQNIEVPVKFMAGANEKLYTSAYASRMTMGGVAPFIGTGGMFQVKSGYIVKDYIENKDRLQVDVHGNITMSSMTVEVSAKVDSSTYVLPITNNITVNLHSGTTTVQQSIALLPGAEMTVGKNAVLSIAQREETLNGYKSGGYHLIVYDRDEWFYGIDMESGDEVPDVQYAFGSSITGMYPLPNVPGRAYNRTQADLKDAVLNVNGKVTVSGGLYTTMGGGKIYTSEGTGVIEMVNGSGPDLVTYQANGGTSLMIPMNSASLMNDDGSYLATGPSLMDDTIPATEAGTTFTYCKMHGWHPGECEACASNVQITFVINGVSITQEFEAGSVPTYNGTIGLPKPPYACYSYAFAGWSTEANGGGTKYPDDTALPAATADVTYYAYYTETIKHTPNDDDGDCTTAIKCTECDAVTTAAKTHVDGNDKNHVCDNDGCNVDNVTAHTPAADDGDCTTAILCTECGEETTAAKSHVDGDDKNHVCDNAGCTVDNVDGGHTPAADDGDCTTAIYCTECGEETTAAKTHVDGNDKNHVCDNDGCNVDNVTAHTPAADDGDCTTAIYCTECEAVITEGKAAHVADEDDGDCTTAVKCVNCSKNAVEAEANHDWAVLDYTDDGDTHTIAYYCKNDNCDEDKTESGNPHDYESGITEHTCACGDVEKFTIRWDTNGDGTVDDTTSVEYGTVPTHADGSKNATAKYTYTFTGWKDTEGNAPVAVTGEATYTAQFTETANTYKITYKVNDEQVHEESYAYGAAVTAWAYTPEEGYIFSGWVGVPVTMPAHNVEVFGTTTIKTYTVTWKINGEVYSTNDVKYGATITAPTYTAPAGHTFSGWDVPATMPAENITLDATLTVNTYTITWKIGDQTWTTNPTHGQAITEPDVIVPDNYYGYGWTAEIPETASGNLTIEGYWTAKLVVLDENGNEMQFTSGGLSYYPQLKIAKVGETAYANYRGTNYKEGHTLYLVNVNDETEKYEITYASGATVYPSVPMTENKTLKLTAVPETYTITWKNPDGTNLAFTTVEYGKVPTFPAGQTPLYPDAMAETGYDYAHIGWSEELGGEKLDSIPAATGVATYYAVYSKTAKNYRVTWTVNGEWYKETTFAYGAAITAPQAPTKEGHTFSGWDIPETMPAENITLDAGWTVNTYTVTWKINGNAYTTTNVAYGAAITAPAYNVPEGHTFSGWQDIPATMPARNITLNATLTANTYTVTWLVDGEVFATTQATYGQVIPTPATDPTKEGYTFQAWNTYPATMPANENLRIEAVFTVNKYQVTWFANGGSFKLGGISMNRVGTDVAYDSVIAFTNYNLPTREGYTFTGWNTQADGTGDALTAETVMNTTDDMTVYYAQWQVNTYALTVNILMAQHGVEGLAKQVVLTVPYGSKLLEVLAQAEAEGKIPANGQRYRLKTARENGEVWNWGYLYDNGEWKNEWVYAGLTMPACDFAVDQSYGFNGWMIGEGGSEYWLESDEFSGMLLGWHYIEEDYDDVDGGAWYYFALSTLEEWVGCAFRAEDITLTTKDGVEGYYAFDHETGKWLENYTGVYTALSGDVYYVENGIAVQNKGLVRVYENGEAKYYYFGCGMASCTKGCDAYKAQRNTVHWVENTNGYDLPEWDYTFGDDGVIVHDDELNGFEEQHHEVAAYADGKYYTIDGVKAHWGLFIGDGELLGEEGAYYYARSSGALIVDRDYWISEGYLNDITHNGELVAEGSYHFDAEGRIVWFVNVKNGIYAEDGKMFYYVDGKRNYAGLIQYTGTSDNGITYNNDWIYVRTNGQLATGKYWTTKHNGNMTAATYDFDEYGRMNQFTGIKDGYYYKNGVINYAGLIEIDGAYYYVKTNGEVVKNRNYWITKTNGLMPEKSYNFDADGKITNPVLKDETKEGIEEVDGKLFYYKDGAPCYAGLIQIDGNWYYVKTSGELATGKYWITKTNGYMKQGSYTFDENGVMQNPAL